MPPDSGVLLRLPSRESVHLKATRYLIQGRVQIRDVGPHGVKAFVRGSGHLHRIIYENGVWSCSCEARSVCSHLIAVQTVVVVPRGAR